MGAACVRPVVRPSPTPPVRSPDPVTTTGVADGVSYTRTWDASGPWAIHVLSVDRRACRPVFRARKAGPAVAARERTSILGADALAAVNADFFELPGGRPVGAHVSTGDILIGPGRRPVVAVTDRGLAQGHARIEGWIAHGSDTFPVMQINRRMDDTTARPDPLLLTPAAGIEPRTGAIRIRSFDGGTGRGRGVVRDPRSASGLLEPGELALENARSWAARRAAGDTVEWSVQVKVQGSDEPIVEAVGGFPTLIRSGVAVLSDQEGIRPAFGENRHPRTAIAWNDSTVFLVVVDGRQPPWSDGMTLRELTDLLLGLGAREGLNLDGGGSSAMVIRGETVNRPSDAQGERAVGNAFVLAHCRQAQAIHQVRSALSYPR